MIQFTNVEKRYGAVSAAHANSIAIHDINLTINAGEFVCIVGPSGSGKTTIMNMIAGLEEASSGSVKINGKPGLMFQEAALFPWLSVQENVEFGLKMRGVPAKDRVDHAQALLDLVHLNDIRDKQPHELSGGMRQRVALARTLIMEPDILLMDEPFGALDAQTREHLHAELQEIWKKTGTTIVFITHDIREAVILGNRVIVLSSRPGTIAEDITVPLEHPRDPDNAELSNIAHHIRELLSSNAS